MAEDWWDVRRFAKSGGADAGSRCGDGRALSVSGWRGTIRDLVSMRKRSARDWAALANLLAQHGGKTTPPQRNDSLSWPTMVPKTFRLAILQLWHSTCQ